MTDKALALTRTLPSEPIKTIPALKVAWDKLLQSANLVSPVASVDSVPALHAISLRAVVIDSDEHGSDVYRDPRFCEKNERALSGTGLQKIMAAAGVSMERHRIDDRSQPNYCEIEVTVEVSDFDGVRRSVTKAKELDLRDGAADAMTPEKIKGPGDQYPKKTGKMKPLTESALADRRRHIQSLAETKALYRALRSILQLKQKYTVDELKKPFVVPKLVPALDPTDPEQKRALIEMAVGGSSRLYGREGSRERHVLNQAPPRSLPLIDADDTSLPPTGFDESDFDAPAFPEPEPEPESIIVCSCPCGCQLELEQRIVDICMDRIGTPRCADCYPARRFDVKRHEDVGDLGIPKMSGLTAARVIEGLRGK